MENKNKIYTNAEDIKNKVLSDYQRESSELTSLFFDFDVELPEKELLSVYAEIVDTINGDVVLRLENVKTGEENNIDKVWGAQLDLIPEGRYEYTYSGNYKDFLESFNDQEEKTGLYRVMDIEKNDNLVGGIKLDFIW